METEFTETVKVGNVIGLNWDPINLVNIYESLSTESVSKHMKYCVAFLLFQHSSLLHTDAQLIIFYSKNAGFQFYIMSYGLARAAHARLFCVTA